MAEWIKLSTRTFVDSKVRKLKPLDQLAWVRLLVWCGAEETDGFIEDDAPQYAGVTPKAVGELVRVGLVESVAGGWVIVGWARWQRTKAQLEAEREANRKRAASARDARRTREGQ